MRHLIEPLSDWLRFAWASLVNSATATNQPICQAYTLPSELEKFLLNIDQGLGSCSGQKRLWIPKSLIIWFHWLFWDRHPWFVCASHKFDRFEKLDFFRAEQKHHHHDDVGDFASLLAEVLLPTAAWPCFGEPSSSSATRDAEATLEACLSLAWRSLLLDSLLALFRRMAADADSIAPRHSRSMASGRFPAILDEEMPSRWSSWYQPRASKTHSRDASR